MKVIMGLVVMAFGLGCSSTPKSPAPPAATAPVVEASKPGAVAPAEAKTPALIHDQWMACKRSEDSRMIEVEGLKPQGCKLWYTKNGTKNSIASSEQGKTHCEQIGERIRTNLEAAGFNCSRGKTETIEKKGPAPASTPSSQKSKSDNK